MGRMVYCGKSLWLIRLLCLLRHGVEFVKTPDGGSMKGLAFIKDPDGYWIEVGRQWGCRQL